MKKRLNLKLVLLVVVGLVVVGGGVHLVHTWQVRRTADMLLVRAQAEREAGNLSEAQELYSKYLKYRPGDVTASVDLANTIADLVEGQGGSADRRLVFAAYGAMENALRKDPDNQQVRRRLTKFVMDLRRFHDAKEHLQYLLDESPDDAELMLDLARCHVALGENAQAVEVLEATRQEAPEEVDAYRLLAEVWGSRLGDLEKGRQVLDEMVEANENNWRAHWVRATYRLRSGDPEGSQADTERAAELAPEQAEVLLLVAEQAGRRRDREAARASLQRGIELYPEDERFYQALATIEQRQGNLQEAIEHLLKGQEVLPQSSRIAWFLADLQLQRKDTEGAAETVARLPELGFSAEMVDLMRARLEMAHGRWAKARGMLERVRPLLARDTNLSLQIELMLGLCYAELRQPDLAMQAAERALILDPTSPQARRLKVQQYSARGNYEAALGEVERMFRSNQVDPALAISALSMMLRQEMFKPAEQRNWQPLEELLAELETRTTADVEIQVFRAELLYQQGKPEESQQLIKEQLEKHPRSVALWLAKAGLEERLSDAARAREVLEEAQDKVGD